MTAKLQRNAKRAGISPSAIRQARTLPPEEPKPYNFAVKPPELPRGVVPAGAKAPVMAADDLCYTFGASAYINAGFPGYPYLAQLTARPEYRAMASALATETTRKWIEFTSKADDDGERIAAIEAEFTKLNVRNLIATCVTQDAFFGRAQIFIDLRGADVQSPLILDARTVPKGSLVRLSAVEAIWTTPNAYNAQDPSRADFYVPTGWFMLGTEVHATRMLTIITRPMPNILMPAFNFGGISLSQLAEPYVNNWLRTRQSVADLIYNFSITCLKTSMDQVLQGDDDGTNVFKRADLFNATRSNRGLMLLDKDREELTQVNTPLSGLHELQAQSQEQMCAVSRTPAIVLTGISPGGLNASSDSEIRVYYDWINAQQEAFWRAPLEVILKVVQLSLYGDIDHDIGFNFVPLYQPTPTEAATVRKSDADAAVAYIGAGVLDPTEERERLAADPLSGYNGIDITKVPAPPVPEDTGIPPGTEGDPIEPMAGDGEFKEGDHPRADNGQFGSGGGSGESKATNKPLGKLAISRVMRNGKPSVRIAVHGNVGAEGRAILDELKMTPVVDMSNTQEIIVTSAEELDAVRNALVAKGIVEGPKRV